MKQILVVCVGIPTGESITAELNTIFRGVAQAEFCLCHQLREKAEGRDIVLFSSRYCQALCREEPVSTLSLPAQRVINYRNLQEVIELEAGSRVLLVNDDKDTAAEAIGQLMEIGLTDLYYFPCYPGSPGHPEISIAITPGERSYVPDHVTRVIDIGVRTLDIRTIYDLARLLGAEHLLDQSLVARYLSQIVTVSKSLSQSRRQTERTERLLAGIFDQVDSGTVFIDEIGDASPELQAKLLRALEEKSIRRVGGAEEIPIRAAIVAATNKDLPAMIREGKFREDLFFRLNMFPLTTIPLRRRPGDILPLLRHFLGLEPELTETLLGPEITQFLQSYRWPGNVRELMNVAEYIKLTHEGRPLTQSDLPAYMSAAEADGDRVFLSRPEYLVLSAVSGCGPRGVGRNRIQALLSESGAGLGIGKIRTILRTLEERGLIAQEKSGCAITERGVSVLGQFQGSTS